MIEFAWGAQTVFLVLAFGLRSFLHWRRTGSTGFRVGRGTPVIERLAVALLVIGGTLSVAGLVADMAGGAGSFGGAGAPAGFVVGAALIVTGVLLVLAAQTNMGRSWRVGVDPSETTELVTNGLFRYVRNPIFLGLLVFWVGIAVVIPNVLSIAAPIIAFVGIEIQVRHVEEPYLRRVHGAAYDRYTGSTGRFLPYLGRMP